MAGHRLPRVNEQLKREITDVLRHEVKDPRVGMVTITGVQAAPDLSLARVFFTALGDAEERERTLEGLRAAAPYVRGELGRRLRLRRVPELRFLLDDTLERGLRIERLLREVAEEGEGEGEGEGGGEGEPPSRAGEAGG